MLLRALLAARTARSVGAVNVGAWQSGGVVLPRVAAGGSVAGALRGSVPAVSARMAHPAQRAIASGVRLQGAADLPSPMDTHGRRVQVLEGRCGCGSVGWAASGPSALNFVCHCSVCRAAAGQPALAAVGFKRDQLTWHNKEGMEVKVPAGSRNPRYFCKSCGDYIGEDALRPLGMLAVPLSTAVAPHGEDKVPAEYQPNLHIFYGSRVEDVTDSTPKWETLPDGRLLTSSGQGIPEPSGSGAVPTQLGTGLPPSSLRKDVLATSPCRAPEAGEYVFTEADPGVNHVTFISPEKVQERKRRKYLPSPGRYVPPASSKRQAIVIGGGHNGLVSAAYLAKAGLDVLVLERRHVLGGAAVTEELVPGFKFSRASYLAGLLRPQIIEDLDLPAHGFKYLPRNPSSFTPSAVDGPLEGKYLLLGEDEQSNWASIAQFSRRDADAFPAYEAFLGKVREVVTPLLDAPPPDLSQGGLREKMRTLRQLEQLARVSLKNREVLVPFYELFTAPAAHILDRWFESEMLKTTLATDAVIGAMCSPSQAGSAYVLLHHVMGEAAGKKGVWAYVQGGMGAVSNSIAAAARQHGAELVTNATVDRILYEGNHVRGVQMEDGSELHADIVLAGCTPQHAFLELLPGWSRDSGNTAEESPLPPAFVHHIRHLDNACGAFKINCAVDRLPNFACFPSPADGSPGPQHRGTIHFETRMEEIEHAYRQASMGMPAIRPVVEMTIPSSLDSTIAPPGKHVVQLFVQFAPYDVDPKFGRWADPAFKTAFVNRVFGIVDEFCPGFSSSVIAYDALSPLDLERVFGLHKGNIFHGALSLHQLGYNRPMAGYSSHRSPLKGLYICGSGAHPGGGVMGAPGRNCANVVLSDLSM